MTAKKSEETIVDVAEVYTKTEQYVNKNGKTIATVIGALALLFVGYMLYQRYVVEPKNEEAAASLVYAQLHYEKDSLNLALNGDGVHYGFLDIINEFSGTPSANMATYAAGTCYLNMGEYELAKDYFMDSQFDAIGLEATRLGAIGDCYVELGDYEEAISYFNKSVNFSDNEFTAPIYLKKAGLAYEKIGEMDKALSAYERIKKDYSESTIGRDIEKYIARVSN
ncbi:MAG: tetratricopeptide repeat protein [Flavobacteriales bacterium]|nr:tetratricopeptide repeat protein [Flavobacteriales bacterium]